MLDVHAPHKPIEGIREFLLHLFTITVGLLIATQIESCMEWRHHVHLAEEARNSLRQEIEQNLKDLKDAQPGLKAWRDEVNADLATMQRIQEKPDDAAAQKGKLTVSTHFMSLRDTAWRTAESTGALGYMPYDEAQRYARIYKAQAELLAAQEKPTEDAAGIFGLIARFHWHDDQKVTAEQASAVAERLGQAQLHLAAGSVLLRENIEVNQAFLDNREPKSDFGENIH